MNPNIPIDDRNWRQRLRAPLAATLMLGMCGSAWAQLPQLSVADTTVDEAAGTADITVSLSAPAVNAVTVTAFTRVGTTNPATAGQDYFGSTEILNFAVGETSQSFSVQILEDAETETTETFLVLLTSPENAPIGTGSATVSITDNDTLPLISVADAAVSESDGTVSVEISLSQAATIPIEALVYTRAGSATGGEDYYGTTEEITFAPGETSQSVDVVILNDDITETPETFAVRLGATNAEIEDNEGIVTITDDEPESSLSVAPASGVEDAGSISVSVTLDPAANNTVEVTAFTRAGSATPGSDYFGNTYPLVFAPGETEKTVEIPVLDDTAAEDTETLKVILTSPTNAVIATAEAEVSIEDNDSSAVPTLSIGDAEVTEGAQASLTLELSEASALPVQVTAFTRKGSATPGRDGDFFGQTTRVTFAPGETEANLEVTTLQDDLVEGDEDFLVLLTNPANAEIADGSATVVIKDDETSTVTVSIGSAEVTEGTDSEVSVEVTLSAASAVTVDVEVASREGTAISGPDYGGRNFDVSFAPGETTKTVSWAIIDDSDAEPTETFRTVIVSAENAEIGSGGTVTIIDDD